jgi:fumarylacetoacetase
MAIGDSILDLVAAHDAGYFGGLAERAAEACAAPALNHLMALGQPYWSALREQAADLLDAGSAAYRDNPRLGDRLLVPQDEAELLLPLRWATTPISTPRCTTPPTWAACSGPTIRCLPNYKWVPIGYHGRASSLVPSGTPVRRPQGQTKAATRRRSSDRAGRWITRWRSAASWGRATRWARPCRSTRRRSACSGSAW